MEATTEMTRPGARAISALLVLAVVAAAFLVGRTSAPTKVEMRGGGYRADVCDFGPVLSGPVCGSWALATCCASAPGGGYYDYSRDWQPRTWECDITWKNTILLCSPKGIKRANKEWRDALTEKDVRTGDRAANVWISAHDSTCTRLDGKPCCSIPGWKNCTYYEQELLKFYGYTRREPQP